MNKLGKDKSKIVFIGNLHFQVTELELNEIFSQVGPIVSLVISREQETNPSRCIAFCEYRDVETADSAVNNLNNYMLRGRALRVSRADKNTDKVSEKALNVFEPVAMATPAAVTEAVKKLTPTQMANILTEFKQLFDNHPAVANQLLSESPQLSLALLQIQFLFGLLNNEDVQSLVDLSKRPQIQQKQAQLAQSQAKPPQTTQAQPSQPQVRHQIPPQIPPHTQPGYHHPNPTQPPPHAQPPHVHPVQPPAQHYPPPQHHYPPQHYPPQQHYPPPQQHYPPPQHMPAQRYPGGAPPAAPHQISPEDQNMLNYIANLSENERTTLRKIMQLTPQQMTALAQKQPKLANLVSSVRSLQAKGINVPL